MDEAQNADYGIPEPGSPTAEKMERLLRLVAHMHGCVRRGGPSNYLDFLDPYDRALVTEALQIDGDVCDG